MSIRAIRNPWRDAMLPASFRQAYFFVESNTTDGGQRVALHELPKQDVPYAELMGRRAKRFTVRAYCISYPVDMGNTPVWPLYMRDYRLARDILQARLDDGQYGPLQLPYTDSPYSPGLIAQIQVACERYRLTEEERFGGYCVFEIGFVEAGSVPGLPVASTAAQITAAYNAMLYQVQQQAGTPSPAQIQVAGPPTSGGQSPLVPPS